MKKICYVTTSPLIVNFFLVPHLLYLRGEYAVSLAVTQPGEVPLAPLPGVEVIALEIRRRIAPSSDLRSLWRLFRLFRQRRFDIVHSFGPKAGFLAMQAAAMAGVSTRLHTFTGQVWAARKGAARALLKGADRVTARAATRVLADSRSQRDFLVGERVVPADKCVVLGKGSVSGVDLQRFKPDAAARAAVRGELRIADDEPLVLFLGRMTRDKGVLDLARAFGGLDRALRAVLLFVGPDEDGLKSDIERLCGDERRLRVVGYTDRPERYLAAADILCLPSYREGFGSVVIEAGASGVPAVASRIYGVTDAVLDGETGLLFEPGDTRELAEKLSMLLGRPELRRRLGEAARARAQGDFSQQELTRLAGELYRSELASRPCAS